MFLAKEERNSNLKHLLTLRGEFAIIDIEYEINFTATKSPRLRVLHHMLKLNEENQKRIRLQANQSFVHPMENTMLSATWFHFMCLLHGCQCRETSFLFC